MRQVPVFHIVGPPPPKGRVATQMRRYLALLGANVTDRLEAATHILVLLKDSQIDPFLRDLSPEQRSGRTFVHFSGSLVTPLAYGAHPLFSFSGRALSEEELRAIPFVVEREGPGFARLLPGLPNRSFAIPRHQKPLYHALCVMAGNFPVLLWQETFAEAHRQFGARAEWLRPYLQSIVDNAVHSPETALTGPLVRGDLETLRHDLSALRGSKLESLFEAFVKWKGVDL